MAEKRRSNVFVELNSRNQVNKLTLIFKPLIKFGVLQTWKKQVIRRWHSKSSLTTSSMNRKRTYGVTSRRTCPLKWREHTTSPVGWRLSHWLTHHPCTVRSLERMLLKQTGNTCNSTVLVLVESSWVTTIKGRLPFRKQKKQYLALWRSTRPGLYITWGSQTKSAKPNAGRKLQSRPTTTAASFSHSSAKLIFKIRKTRG